MYQYTTFAPLALSKSYFPTIRECSAQLRRVVKLTNTYRKMKDQTALTLAEIESGQRLLRLDVEKHKDVMNLFGSCTELTTENLDRPTYESKEE